MNTIIGFEEEMCMASIKSPAELAGDILNRISKQERLAFCSAFFSGLFCHLFIITNSMYNNDDIRYLYVTFDKPELGRWLQTYFAGISSYFSLPVINCILGLFYIGLAAMTLTALFDLKEGLHILLISSMIAVFPTVACIYSYTFAADPFMLSLFFSCLAAYYVTRTDKGRFIWLAGSFFLMLSVAIYQAYLPFTLLLMLLWYIAAILSPERYDNSTLIRKGIDYVLMLAVGMGAYAVGMKVTLAFKDISLRDYQGIAESSLPGPSMLLTRMKLALTDFIEFFKPAQILSYNSFMKIALALTVLTLLAVFVCRFAQKKTYTSGLRILLLAISLACIPFSVNVMYLISETVQYHMLMRHAWCILFIAPLILFELFREEMDAKRAHIVLTEWCMIAAVTIAVWNYALLDNIGYYNMNFRYEKTYAHCLELRDRIKDADDYDRHLKLCFVGRYSKTFKAEGTEELLENMTGMKGAKIGSGTRIYVPFFQNCLGEDVEGVTDAEEAAMKENPLFREMPAYPDDGCIRRIDDVLVIKLNKD